MRCCDIHIHCSADAETIITPIHQLSGYTVLHGKPGLKSAFCAAQAAVANDTPKKILAVLYRGGDAAKNPRLLGRKHLSSYYSWHDALYSVDLA